jgi:cell division protease FtsH
MVTQWGMTDSLGPRVYGEREDMIFLGREITQQRDYSDEKAILIDKEIDALIAEALAKAENIVKEHCAAMDRIAEYLLKNETIEREQFSEIVGFPHANTNIKNA